MDDNRQAEITQWIFDIHTADMNGDTAAYERLLDGFAHQVAAAIHNQNKESTKPMLAAITNEIAHLKPEYRLVPVLKFLETMLTFAVQWPTFKERSAAAKDETNLCILCAIRDSSHRALAVEEIARAVSIPESDVRQRLELLDRLGLIKPFRLGRERLAELGPHAVEYLN